MTYKDELDRFYIGEIVYTKPNSPNNSLHKVTIEKIYDSL